jgi:hypothetical protein
MAPPMWDQGEFQHVTTSWSKPLEVATSFVANLTSSKKLLNDLLVVAGVCCCGHE